MDSRVWTDAIAALNCKRECRIITYDLSGHGQSETRNARGTMGSLIRDAENLMDGLELKNAVFVGLGLGGMVAQGLAVKRLDLVRGLILVNSAAKLGIKTRWKAQVDQLKENGMAHFYSTIWSSWFSRRVRNDARFAHWRAMLEGMDVGGFIAGIEAISGTDFYTPISGLSLPTLGISAYNDQVFPPDLMRETVDVIKGADFQIMPRVGHLSMVEAPVDFSSRIDAFLTRIGHQTPPEV